MNTEKYPCSRPGEFKCAHNGSADKDCVNPVEICNGSPQCNNGWDEDPFVCRKSQTTSPVLLWDIDENCSEFWEKPSLNILLTLIIDKVLLLLIAS